jgi:hypothetical protein
VQTFAIDPGLDGGTFIEIGIVGALVEAGAGGKRLLEGDAIGIAAVGKVSRGIKIELVVDLVAPTAGVRAGGRVRGDNEKRRVGGQNRVNGIEVGLEIASANAQYIGIAVEGRQGGGANRRQDAVLADGVGGEDTPLQLGRIGSGQPAAVGRQEAFGGTPVQVEGTGLAEASLEGVDLDTQIEGEGAGAVPGTEVQTAVTSRTIVDRSVGAGRGSGQNGDGGELLE